MTAGSTHALPASLAARRPSQRGGGVPPKAATPGWLKLLDRALTFICSGLRDDAYIH